MTKSEVSFLLAAIYVYERRNDAVSKAQVEAWHQLLEDVEFEDAKAAVTAHFSESDRMLSVAALRASIKQARVKANKADSVAETTRVPDADPDDIRAFKEAIKEGHWLPERNPEDFEQRPRRWWMKFADTKEEDP